MCLIVDLKSYPIELGAVFDIFVKCVDFDSNKCRIFEVFNA